MQDNQSLGAFAIDGESRATANAQGGVTRLRRQLDILRIMVHAANDDQVFEPAGDEQLAVVDKSKVARAQERAFAAVDFAEMRGECLLGFVMLLPISCGDGLGSDPV